MTRRRHPRPSVALCVLLLALGTSVPSLASAADTTRVLSDYRVTSWTEQDGLPTGTIWSITQDADGFLWLGTDAGLIRFDGTRFATPEATGVPAIQSGAVRALYASRDGSLWIGFAEGGIARLRNQHVTSFGPEQGLPASAIASIVEDRAGVIWAATNGGLYSFRSDRWSLVDDAVGSPGSGVLSVSPSGDVIVASRNTVFRRPSATDTFAVVHDGNQPVVDAVQDAAGRVWITDRITGFRAAASAGGATGPQNGKGVRLMVDRSGSLWVATFGQGLWRVRTSADGRSRQIDVATDVNGLSNNVIYALFEDRDGNIWAGTSDGLNRLTQHRAVRITSLGLVTGLEPADGDNVWAATAEGLVKLSRTGEEIRRVPGLQPRATHVDADRTLWVATDAALLRVRGDRDPELVTRVAGGMRSMTSDPRGGLLIIATDGRMLRYAGGRLEPFTAALSAERRLSSLFTGSDGTVWVASAPRSLVALTPRGETRVYDAAQGFDVGALREFFEDSSGAVWVAGSDGLARIKNGRARSVHRSDGLPAESLTGIAEDDNGNLWIGAATGIIRLDRAAFDMPPADRASLFAMYDSVDGVAGTTGWIGQGSALRATDGRIWFLTASGITIVDPAALKQNAAARPLRIEQVAVDDRRFTAAERHSIEPGVSRLQINFTVPNLTSPRRTRFRYRLEGFDSDWIDAGRQRVATYTNLPPREYTFVVQATAGDGSWGGPRTAWRFAVEPAFYQTAWFSALCVIALAGLGWSAWRIRVLQVRRQFAMLLAERTRLSRELHDTLLQSFVGVALQCDALASEADATQSSPLGAGLVRLRKQVEGYIRECRQSIWELRSATLDENGLRQALDDATKRAAAESGLAVQLTVTGTSRRCERRIEEQLLRIAQEASTNAARHSHGRILRVELAYEPDKIILRVDDDGCGFDPLDPLYQLQGHYGLVSMRERAETVAGSLSISSKSGAGTSIRVVIPSAADGHYLDDEPFHADSVYGRSSDRTRRNRTDHQPAA